MKSFLRATSLIALCSVAVSASSSLPHFADVQVVGAKRIPAATIIGHAQISKTMTPQDFDAALNRLLATGFFEDVKIYPSGKNVRIQVTEKPSVRRVTFHGTKLPSAADIPTLQQKLSLQPGKPYSSQEALSDAAFVQANLVSMGFPQAQVTAATNDLKEGCLDVVFDIDLGDSAVLEGIFFRGNHAFEPDFLSSVISSQAYAPQTAALGFLTQADIYTPQRVKWDMKILEDLYLNEGFIDFHIVSHVVEFIPERQGFFLTFTLHEGQRSTITGVEISASTSGLNLEALKEEATEALVGQVYRKRDVEKIVNSLEALLESHGLPNFAVGVRLKKEPDGVRIVLDLIPHDVVEVRHIVVEGHNAVAEEYIRNLLPYAEGDVLTRQRFSEGRKNLEYVDLFTDVAFKVIDTDDSSCKDVSVNLTEHEGLSHFFFDAGATYESKGKKGVFGAGRVKLQNFLNRGHTLSFVGGKTSTDLWTWSLEFERHFLPKALGFNAKIFYDIQQNHIPLTAEDRQEKAFRGKRSRHAYDETDKGFELAVSYNFSRQFSHIVSYGFSHETFEVPKEAPSAHAHLKDKKDLRSSLGYSVIYDQRNRRHNPSQGYRMRADITYSGFPGTVHMLEGSLSGILHIPLSQDQRFQIQLEGRGAALASLEASGNTRIKDRFFLGGRTLRGFEPQGIGPRNAEKSSLGGHRLIRGRAELIAPLTSARDSTLKGVLFTDMGCVWGLPADVASTARNSSFFLRSSVGLGLRVQIPNSAKFFIGWGFPLTYHKGFDRCFPFIIDISF